MTTDSMTNRKHTATLAETSVVQTLANRSGATRPTSPDQTREMVQQTVVAARDSDCFPQGFVRLVGYRHSDIRPFSWIKSRPVEAPFVAPSSLDEAVPIG